MTMRHIIERRIIDNPHHKGGPTRARTYLRIRLSCGHYQIRTHGNAPKDRARCDECDREPEAVSRSKRKGTQ